MLRGINVSGGNRVAMEDLRALFHALGADDVRTYIQSGNVICAHAGTAGDLRATAEDGIRRTLGLDVTVVVRTKAQLEEVVGGNPFVASGADPARLHVTFLASGPDPGRVLELVGTRAEPDEFHLAGEEIYLHCPNGYGRTKLSNAFFERRLGVAMTTRNWRTVVTLAELAGA